MDNFNIKIIGDIEQDPCVSNKSPMYLWRHSTEPPAFNYIWIKNDAVYYHNGHEWLQMKDYSFDISSPSLDTDGNELCHIIYKGSRINPITVSSAVDTSKGSNLQQDLEIINETLGYCSEQIDDLSDVAFSGNYNDLINKPTIPSLEGYATLSDLSHKVDKITGKQLSTEDFTTALKQKLINLSNYDDTELSNSLKQLQDNLDRLMNGNTTTAINSFNEIITFLNGIEDTQSLQGIIASIQKQINQKQPFIEDLEKIKRGAGLGSTALQEIPSEYITEEELQAMNFATVEQLEGKQDRIDNLQDINLGAASGISALHQLENLPAVAKSGDYNDLSNKPTIISENRVQELINQAQFPEGEEIKLENYYTKTEVYNKGEVDGKLASKQNKLESGINIKKINGESILGSGNITIEGGSSSDTKVTQTITSTDSTYPLLFSATSDKTTTSEDTARFSSNLKYNPSTDTLTVANISGNASSATTATNANTLNTLTGIDGVNFTGASDVTHYVTCTNAGTTTAKTVTLNGFKLVTGARVSIKFSNTQTNATSGAAMTLKVGNTTAKGMYYKTLPLNGANLIFKTGVIYDFIYDGTYWRLQGDWDAQIIDASFDFSVQKAQFANQLTTPRTINGVSFDGSSDIEIDTTHIGKEHNAVIYFKGPARGKSLSKYEFHTTYGTLVSPRSLAGGIAYLLYNENVVSQAIPLNHVFTGNFFPIKVSTVLTSASGDINTWTDAYLKCGITPTGPIVYSINLTDTNRTDVSNINLDNCMLEGHIYGTF